MSQEIAVTEMAPREYAVRITEGTDTTHHRVVVPSALLEEFLLDEEDAAVLVRESVAFLLERQHADNIPDDLHLGDLADEYEDYLTDLRTRME